MSFESYSQAGQDRFVWEIYDHKTDGRFIDLGSGHAWEGSNTFALELRGWSGLLFDRFHYQKDPTCAKFVRRRATMIEGEVVESLRNASFCAHALIHYLSIDVDGDSGKALASALELPLTYGVITIEHDFYVRGRDLRELERHLLRARGFDLVCEDVSWGQGPFEDWWVNPEVISKEQRDLFRCRNRWWRDVPHIVDDL